MRKYFLFGIMTSSLLFACSTTTNNLSNEDVEQLEQHTEDLQADAEEVNQEPLSARQHRFWQKPNYENQENVLGYAKDTFVIPDIMKDRVQFWIDIYTKHTTSQGVLHDSRFPTIIYETVDFSKIDNDKSLSTHQKFKSEKKYLDERKKYVSAILQKLQGVTDPKELNEEEARYWKMFDRIDEKNKFIEASKKGRLRFQLGQRDRFIQGIFYSGRYLKEMEKIFAENGMPRELTRLPFVESSFNIRARSKVGASGIWQFMRGTGRHYMKVNALIDQRNDPIIATKAASRLLKTNYEILKTWPLAVTAYNYGAAGLKRIVEKYNSTELVDFFGRSPTSRFGFASESFYASFLAAVEVEKNADKYFGPIEIADEIATTDIVLSRPVYYKDIEKFSEGVDEMQNLNPQLTAVIRKNSARIPAQTVIRVPESQRQAFVEFLSRAPAATTPLQKESSTGFISYKINKGDTLYDISKQFRISVDQILQVNQDLDPRVIRPGQVIEIPQ